MNKFRQLIKLVLVLGSLFFYNKTIAQVLPPDFLCVRSDTLFFDIPLNPCGTFNSYEVFFSTNPTTGFTLLDNVTNQGQNFYHHINPANTVFYYYLQSDFNCAGQPVLQSDTLNNELPEVANIQGASVIGNDVFLEWSPSASPEVFAYIVFRNTPIGTIPIDTVFGATTFLDQTADPNNQSETYFILALDECGNTSIFNEPHTTTYLTQTVSECEQEINLTWNLYSGWASGIGTQEVWLGVDGAMPTLFATISPTDTSYIFEDASELRNYCFFIKATETGTTNSANSNEVCLTPDLIEPTRNLVLRNVNVLLDNSVEMNWLWNSGAELQTVEILRGNAASDFSVANSSPAPIPLGNGSDYLDTTADPTTTSVFYKIQTTDNCDSLAESNYASTINLNGTPQADLTNVLSWTDFDMQNAEIDDYSIYRIVSGNSSFLENVPSDITTYLDAVDTEKEEESNVCYYVVANATLTLPDGNTIPITSSSNLTCVEQLASIIAPNAFAPQGRNQIFKPFVVFGETADYQFTVFNRFGELLFETKNQDEGWNGKFKNRIQPMGVYVFQVRIQQQNGRVVEEKGVFTLLR